MGFTPDFVNGIGFNELVYTYKVCLDSKGTIYYNRIAGGMKYDNSDLLRLELIISLLKYTPFDKSGSVGLDCIYDEVVFPGLEQNNFSDTAPTTAGHLQSFLNFANIFCKDCITSTPVGAIGPGEDLTSHLFSQTGTEITLQSGAPIILY
jgi:hypothetical protein